MLDEGMHRAATIGAVQLGQRLRHAVGELLQLLLQRLLPALFPDLVLLVVMLSIHHWLRLL